MDGVIILSFGLLGYAFFLYPLILRRMARPDAVDSVQHPEDQPSVSVLLSVYNEAEVIERKIENFLALEYPPDRLELIIVSDGSGDGTDDLARRAASGHEGMVRLLRQEGRLGKTSALNMAASEARGDILFFTDADSMLKKDCLTMLMRPFADPAVGLAGGRSLYVDDYGRETAGSIYRRYEEMLKQREGDAFGIVGADGAVYAMRKELYSALPPEYINDLLHPVQVVLAGKKAVGVPEALITERSEESDNRTELARQTRMMAQAWLIFGKHARPLLAAGRYGFFWQFISHKVIRWLAVPLMLAGALAAVFSHGFLAQTALWSLGAIALMSALGSKGAGGRLSRAAWLFMLQSAAAMLGLYRLIKGDKFVTWTPRAN